VRHCPELWHVLSITVGKLKEKHLSSWSHQREHKIWIGRLRPEEAHAVLLIHNRGVLTMFSTPLKFLLQFFLDRTSTESCLQYSA
jgi:hypothetical protein